jgi:glycosyltransferase involved in cell wall biosynthesis
MKVGSIAGISPGTPGSSAEPARYVVVTPVRNEEKHLPGTIASMAGQTRLPVQWVVVDDGSTDETPRILEEAARHYPWVTVVRRPDRGFRKSGAGVVEALNDGLARLTGDDWEFLVKLDGDLTFGADYFERCLKAFEEDPMLGIAGGVVMRKEGGKLVVDSPGDPPFHVRGAVKMYRGACWQQVAPLVPAPGWDTIDEAKANRLGWRTRTLADLPVVQHRRTGAADGVWRNWFKNGRANYITGYHPLFMVGKCTLRAVRRPLLVAGLGLFAGYVSGFFGSQARLHDRETVRYLRRQQLRRLFLRPSIYG